MGKGTLPGAPKPPTGRALELGGANGNGETTGDKHDPAFTAY
jgi:hypothetical protein